MLMMSFPSPTSWARAASPLASAAFFSSMISCERHAIVSRICIAFLADGLGRRRSSARLAVSDSTHESFSIAKPISDRFMSVGLESIVTERVRYC